MRLKFCVLFLFTFNYLYTTNAAKILAIFPYATDAHISFVMPYMKALAARGHEITVINGIEPKEKVENLRFITVFELLQMFNGVDKRDITLPTTKWQQASLVANLFFNISNYMLGNHEVQKLLQSNEKFDLLIMEPANVDALFGFAQHFSVPMIGISTFGAAWNVDYLVGNSAPTIYEPMWPYGYQPGQTFWGRLQNWIHITEERLIQHFIYLPKQNEIYEKYFPNANIKLNELRKNFSLIMINQHFSIGKPRLNVPNLIEVGGMHVPETTKPLPADLATFINEAEHGVIYYSMGQDIQIKHLPEGLLKVLLKTFSTIKQRVIWKYDMEKLPNKSSNIYISNWLPQKEILAHPNVKLFISHTGLLSMFETVYYCKPMLGLPIFYDQDKNIQYLKQAGMALSLDIFKLTTEELIDAINKLIQDPSYESNAKALSQRYRDQPMSPLQTAIWWTEYVLRYRGAPHMRLDEESLSFIHYYCLDSLSVIFGRVGLTVFTVFFLDYKIIQTIRQPQIYIDAPSVRTIMK